MHSTTYGCHEEGSRDHLHAPAMTARDFPSAVHHGTIPLGTLNSTGFGIRDVQSLHSANRAPTSPFMGDAFCEVSTRIQSMSSPIGIASIRSQNDMLGHHDPIHSLGQTNFVVQQIPNFPPHKVPGYVVGFPHGLHNSSPLSAMGIKSRPSEGINTRYINNAGSSNINSNAFEHNEGGSEAYPRLGHPYIWNSSSTYYHQPRGPMMLSGAPVFANTIPSYPLWSDAPVFANTIPSYHLWSGAPVFVKTIPSNPLWSGAPVFANTIPSYPLQQVHGLPVVPSPMIKAVRPLQRHKLSPEITENPFFLRLQRAFQDDPTYPPAIHPGSPGSKEPSGNCPIHTQEHVPCNDIHAGGDCTDPTHVGSSAHVGSPAPRQRCHFSCRKTPYDMSNDQAEKYELDIERISRGEDSRTTLIIKNIPNKYTSKMLLAVIDEFNKGTYDFLYLPIDFKTKCNVGYAFINMMDPKQIVPFYQVFHGKKWDKFSSEKVASLAYARIQGKIALVSHFQNSSLMNEDKQCCPLLFHSDDPNSSDPNAGVQEPFPEGSPPTSAHEEGEHTGTSSSASSAGYECTADYFSKALTINDYTVPS